MYPVARKLSGSQKLPSGVKKSSQGDGAATTGSRIAPERLSFSYSVDNAFCLSLASDNQPPTPGDIDRRNGLSPRTTSCAFPSITSTALSGQLPYDLINYSPIHLLPPNTPSGPPPSTASAPRVPLLLRHAVVLQPPISTAGGQHFLLPLLDAPPFFASSSTARPEPSNRLTISFGRRRGRFPLA